MGVTTAQAIARASTALQRVEEDREALQRRLQACLEAELDIELDERYAAWLEASRRVEELDRRIRFLKLYLTTLQWSGG